MKGPAEQDTSALRFCPRAQEADDRNGGFAALTAAVFGAPPLPPWPVFGLYDDERCVAGLQMERLTISSGADVTVVAALRNVAVDADWRGRGLMRRLLERTLPLCDRSADAILLFTETFDLYAHFGFEPLAQSAFEGPAPARLGAGAGVPLDPSNDVDVLDRLLRTRAPVSRLCAVTEDAGLTKQALASGRWPMVYHAGLDALVVSEWEDDTLVLVDIVAPRIPSAAHIAGMIDRRPARLRTLFPPDQLDWCGAPVPEEAGLMMRGTCPKAMRRPFMLPPTVEF